MKPFLRILLVLLIVVTPLTIVKAQCAMCKAAAESTLENNPKSLARGLNKGILFLMGIPYLLVGAIFRKDIFVLLKNLRSGKRQTLSKDKKQWLVFAVTFATVLIILFLIYYFVSYG